VGRDAVLVFTTAVGLLALLLALTPAADTASNQSSVCPPGALVVNATGTFICAFEVEEYTPVFISLHLVQEGGTANLTLTCITLGGCNATIFAYDYHQGSLTPLGNSTLALGQGESRVLAYACTGTCVFGLEVNSVWLGYYTSPAVQVPKVVAEELASLASRDPLVLAVAGLLVVSVPLGWMLTRELGATGVALAATSVLLYTLVYALTGSVTVATLVSALSGLVGVVYALVQGGTP